jgi:pyruvate/2-oxoglutarate/acetoin dehydrogenase E1 component
MMPQPPKTVLKSLNSGLHQALAADRNVILLGEDILDPYGGSFKVPRGLSSQFPDQVLTTPISEAGITGMAGGMALRGLRPVVEIMFGDFTTLAVDQIVNHITKFNGMYHGQVQVPVVIRTPMGGRRGYGPTHSQTLEKIFLGVPGLTVLAPFHLQGSTELGEPGRLLFDAIMAMDAPVLFVEHKLQYPLPLLTQEDLAEMAWTNAAGSDLGRSPGLDFPCYSFKIRGAPKPQITLAAYGYMAHLALKAVYQLAYEDEIFCELIVPVCLSPFTLGPLVDSARRTGRLLAIEEGTLTLGWGAEVLARSAEALGARLRRANRLAAEEKPIPSAPGLEAECLPDIADIIDHVREMV